jgi:hypothetical protein
MDSTPQNITEDIIDNMNASCLFKCGRTMAFSEMKVNLGLDEIKFLDSFAE